MQKIVINACFGGFSLSKEAQVELGLSRSHDEIARDDPRLVELVERLGDAANGEFSQLKVVEIPDGVPWQIEEYDGHEWVAEAHRRWP